MTRLTTAAPETAMNTRITRMLGIRYPIIQGACSGWGVPSWRRRYRTRAAWAF